MNYRSFFTLLMATTGLFIGCGKQDESSDALPQRAPEQVFIGQGTDGTTAGAARAVSLSVDKQASRRETISLPNGREKVTVFDRNAQAVSITEYAAGKRIEKETAFLADGRRQSHSLYREDGSRIESGELHLDGRYQILLFDAKGTRVVLRRLLNKKGEAEREWAFDEAGRTVSDTKLSFNEYSGTRRETLYLDRDGKALYREVTSDKKDYYSVLEQFHPGTTKVKIRIACSERFWSVAESNLEGQVLLEWHISPDKMRVHVNSTQHGGGYELYYLRSDAAPAKDGRVLNFELDAIHEFDFAPPSERYDDRRVSRLIEFDPGQNTPSHVILRVPWSYSHDKTTQWLNAQMQIVKEEVVTERSKVEGEGEKAHFVYNDLVETQTFPDGKPLAKPIDMQRAVFPQFQVPAGVHVEMPVINVRPISTGK